MIISTLRQSNDLKRGDLLLIVGSSSMKRQLAIFLKFDRGDSTIEAYMLGKAKIEKFSFSNETILIFWTGARLSSGNVASITEEPEEEKYGADVLPLSFWQKIRMPFGRWPRRLSLKRVEPGRLIAFLSEEGRDSRWLRVEMITSGMIGDLSLDGAVGYFRCLSFSRNAMVQTVRRDRDSANWDPNGGDQKVVDLDIVLLRDEATKIMEELNPQD